MTVHSHPDADSLATAIAERFGSFVAACQREGRTPHVALTGGTIAIAAYERVAADAADWTDLHVWFGDERFVPAGHAERNDHQAREAMLDRLGVPDEHVHAMPAHGCSDSMAEEADRYGAALPAEGFDLVLLGLGPDGHIASLFPGFAQVGETQRRCVEVFGSPKPPPERISLTLPALNDTRETWFIVSGEGKADAVARTFAPEGSVEETPARGAHGREATRWLLDAAAGAKLPTG